MFCTKCGNPLGENSKFCSKCGTPAPGAANAASPTSAAPTTTPAAPVVPPAAPSAAVPPVMPGAPVAQPAPAAPQQNKGGFINNFVNKHGKKKSIIISVVALVLVAAIVFALNYRAKTKEYDLSFEQAMRFLDAGDYESAILAFEAAIDILPRRADAYIGLADVYTEQGEYNRAVNVYLQALEHNDKNPELYLGLANAYLEMGNQNAALSTLDSGYEKTKDARLQQWAQALRGMNGTSSLSGVVSEYLSGGGSAPLQGARVRLYLNIANELRMVKSASTGADGTFTLSGLVAGTYTLRVDAADHIGIETIEELEDGEAAYTEVFLLIPETEDVIADVPGDLSVYLINALTGDYVPKAEIKVRSGWNNQTGDLHSVGVVYSDDWGWCSLSGMEYGYYTLEISAEEYVTSYHNVAVMPDEFVAEWTLPMSPVLGEGETRIVLTWGEIPRDLDSHMTGYDNGNSFHVFYGTQNFYDSLGRHRVNLDLDDTSSYGPETISIYQGVDDYYTYSIYDYTNGGVSRSTELSYSGATVEVYQGDGMVAEYHVPVGREGYTWDVFRIHEDGSLETINQIGEWYPGDN